MLLKVIVVLLGACSLLINADPKRRYTDFHFVLNRPTNEPNPFATKGVPSDFKSIQKLLQVERQGSKLYDTVWRDAEYAFQSKKELRPDIFVATTPKECYIAVIAYTIETEVTINGTSLTLYGDFNNKFRALTDESSWTNFPYRSFYYLITMAIPGIKNMPDPSSTSWRGINAHFGAAPVVGDKFYFDYFASTSTDRATAERFVKKDGTLIKMNAGTQVAIGIDHYSLYSEDEVLVFPRNKFRVKSFTRNGKVDILELERS